MIDIISPAELCFTETNLRSLKPYFGFFESTASIFVLFLNYSVASLTPKCTYYYNNLNLVYTQLPFGINPE